MSQDKGFLVCALWCILIFALPIPITSVVIGALHKNDECQYTDSIGLNLSQWLMGAGIGSIISLLSILTLIILTFLSDSATAFASLFTLIILNSLFNIIYSIIGSVVLFRSNMECLTDGTDLGIMALIVLIFYWLSLIQTCGTNTQSK